MIAACIPRPMWLAHTTVPPGTFWQEFCLFYHYILCCHQVPLTIPSLVGPGGSQISRALFVLTFDALAVMGCMIIAEDVAIHISYMRTLQHTCSLCGSCWTTSLASAVWPCSTAALRKPAVSKPCSTFGSLQAKDSTGCSALPCTSTIYVKHVSTGAQCLK